jgi:hypothetical protein
MSADTRPRRRRGRRFHVGGQEWRVQFVPGTDPRILDETDGTPLQGAAFMEDCVILIRDDLGSEAREEVFVHELEHVINKVSGAAHEMGLRLRSAKARDEHEERIVRARTPLLHRVLKDLGFRFPKGLLQ